MHWGGGGGGRGGPDFTEGALGLLFWLGGGTFSGLQFLTLFIWGNGGGGGAGGIKLDPVESFDFLLFLALQGSGGGGLGLLHWGGGGGGFIFLTCANLGGELVFLPLGLEGGDLDLLGGDLDLLGVKAGLGGLGLLACEGGGGALAWLFPARYVLKPELEEHSEPCDSILLLLGRLRRLLLADRLPATAANASRNELLLFREKLERVDTDDPTDSIETVEPWELMLLLLVCLITGWVWELCCSRLVTGWLSVLCLFSASRTSGGGGGGNNSASSLDGISGVESSNSDTFSLKFIWEA